MAATFFSTLTGFDTAVRGLRLLGTENFETSTQGPGGTVAIGQALLPGVTAPTFSTGTGLLTGVRVGIDTHTPSILPYVGTDQLTVGAFANGDNYVATAGTKSALELNFALPGGAGVDAVSLKPIVFADRDKANVRIDVYDTSHTLIGSYNYNNLATNMETGWIGITAAPGQSIGTIYILSPGMPSRIGVDDIAVYTGSPPIAPTLAVNAGLTLDEGGSAAIGSSVLALADPDTLAAQLVYTLASGPANGVMFRDADGNGAMGAGEGLGLGSTFTQADIDAGRIRYVHDGSETTADGFRFTATDGSTTLLARDFTLTVRPVNDAPVLLANTGLAASEGGTLTVTAAMLAATDVEQGPGALSFMLGGAPLHGTLWLDGDGNGAMGAGEALLAGSTFTQADIDAGRLRYSHDGIESVSDYFAVTLSDGTASLSPRGVSVTVAPVDDAAIALDDAFVTDEASLLGAGRSLFAANGTGLDSDPDSSLAITAVNGAAGAVGTQILLPSGALLTVQADGTYLYDPNGAFTHLAGPGQGVALTALTDSFTYTLNGQSTATVTITVNGLDSEADVLVGTTAADTLDGGIGIDRMTGGLGDDTYLVDNTADVVIETAGEGNDTIRTRVDYTLAAGLEVETLRANDPHMTQGLRLTGNEFGQWLIGGAGIDTLTGLGGNDRYWLTNAEDVVVEAVGGGFDRIYSAFTYTLAADAEIEYLSTESTVRYAAFDLTGNDFAQVIVGNMAGNRLDGRGGADTLEGVGGNDIYVVDNLGDVVIERVGEGTADRVQSSISYRLGGGAEIEHLETTNREGLDALRLTGNAFDQALYGNAGANWLDGGAGADVMNGYLGDDWYFVDNAGDRIVEIGGWGTADRVLSSVSYTLEAGAQIEVFTTTLTTGTAALNLTGNGFAQAISGNDGANVLAGGGGNDTIRGYGGADTIVFDTALNAVGNVDRVIGFVSGEDRFRLDATLFAGLGSGVEAGELAVNRTGLAGDGDDRLVYNQANGQLLYDADGAGGSGAVLFAVLDVNLTLAATDFIIG